MNFKKDEIIKMICEKREMVTVIAILSTVLIFSGVVVINIMSVKITERDVENYDELIRNPYEKYENIMGRTKINDLIDSEQFKEMNYNSNLTIEEDPEIKLSPFKKSY